MTFPSPIYVSAVILMNQNGEVLTVRKNGTTGFMLPGGKPEPDETPVQTARREVFEELGINCAEEDLTYCGTFEAEALNEPGRTVRAEVFRYLPIMSSVPESPFLLRAEIVQAQWVNPADTHLEHQAPLNTAHIFPALVAQELHSAIEKPSE
ncbi:NUDIX hydrolase [Rothia sp. P6271]|uniref:NUDIX hydrolase n=1 Tax=Rothia sp. P6271 TaxID=3402659 RepID=UPI003AC92883